MKKLMNASFVYLTLGLVAGLFYREFTRAQDFPETEFTQLGVLHTHLLTLGFIMMLVFLALEKVFRLSRSPKLFSTFFWLYNLGVVVTVGVMVWHGTLTVLGESGNAMISGIAGLGHILLTAGLIVFAVALSRAVNATTREDGPAHVEA